MDTPNRRNRGRENPDDFRAVGGFPKPKSANEDADRDAGNTEGKGHFFAVNLDVFRKVCWRGLNEAICYLILARGSLADNRTTSWSTNSIEERTGISRKKAKACLTRLEDVGILSREVSSPTRPRRTLFPQPPLIFKACGLQRLTPKQSEMLSSLPRPDDSLSNEDRRCIQRLEKNGWAVHRGGIWHVFDGATVSKPEIDWVWLPNSLVDGIDGQNAPVEQIRQTQSVEVLASLIELYRLQELTFCGGIPTKILSQTYTRKQLSSCSTLNMYEFNLQATHIDPHSPFVKASGGHWDNLKSCFKVIDLLKSLGLITFVEHVFDGPYGEILFPLAQPYPGRDVTDAEATLYEAAKRAADYLLPTRFAFASEIRVPIQRHIQHVTMIGVARLRHRPRTTVTSEWLAQSERWAKMTEYFEAMIGDARLQVDVELNLVEPLKAA